MGERPTPEELAEYWGGLSLLKVLRQEGYRIVHPDDVPEDCSMPVENEWYRTGWNACRAHIFGEGT